VEDRTAEEWYDTSRKLPVCLLIELVHFTAGSVSNACDLLHPAGLHTARAADWMSDSV